MQQELFNGSKPKVRYKRVKTLGTGKYALVPIFPEKFNPSELTAVHRYTDMVNREVL